MNEELIYDVFVENREKPEPKVGETAAEEAFWKYYFDTPYSCYEWNDGVLVETL